MYNSAGEIAPFIAIRPPGDTDIAENLIEFGQEGPDLLRGEKIYCFRLNPDDISSLAYYALQSIGTNLPD
jgi:hypothetical protein